MEKYFSSLESILGHLEQLRKAVFYIFYMCNVHHHDDALDPIPTCILTYE